MRYVSDACEIFGIFGSFVNETVTAHGLKGSVFRNIFECGHALSAVGLRNGQCYLKSFEPYMNSDGSLGLRQQLDS